MIYKKEVMMKKGFKWTVLIGLFCSIYVITVLFYEGENSQDLLLLSKSTSKSTSSTSFDVDIQNMKSLLYLLNNSIIPFEGYPIPQQRWDIVSNTTCIVNSKNNNSKNNATASNNNNDNILPLDAIILGVQKGGSTAMGNYLKVHPNVIGFNRELHFLSTEMDTNIQHQEKGGIDQQYWQRSYLNFMTQYVLKQPQQQQPKNKKQAKRQRKQSKSLLSQNYVVEKSPSYITVSDRVPQRILCLCPSVKLVLLLRHPIDRAYSQYNMHYQTYQQKKQRRERKNLTLLDPWPWSSFDEWITTDYEVLQELGVLNPNGYQGTHIERQGWSIYTKLATMGQIGGLGRGLYSLQISQWIEAFQQANRQLVGGNNPQLLVLSSEFSKENPQDAYNQVCDHLGIPRHDLPDAFINNEKGTNTRDYSKVSPMLNTTRQLLEDIFEPYNRQLYDLLGQQQVWKNIWETTV